MTTRDIQREETKKRIYDVAFKLFDEFGYDKVKVSDIAKAANVSVGSVYYHYKNKEAIIDYGYYELLEVISDVARRLIEEDYFLQRGGKRIPIIIQDLEFTWYVLEATKKVNIHDEAHDFFKALESGNM